METNGGSCTSYLALTLCVFFFSASFNSHWEIKGRFRKRVVLANVPSFRFSFRGNIRRNHPFGNHPSVNKLEAHWEIKGRFRKRVVLANVPSFRFSFRGNIRQNHPFGNHPFANPRNRSGNKSAFRLPGRAGITSIERWNLRPVIFGAVGETVSSAFWRTNFFGVSRWSPSMRLLRAFLVAGSALLGNCHCSQNDYILKDSQGLFFYVMTV